MSYKILHNKEDKEQFKRYWNLFIDENLSSTCYTENFISYSLAHGNCLDESFVVIRENKPVGIAFVPIEKNQKINSISLNNEFVYAPLSYDKKGEEVIYKHIDKLAKKHSVSKIKFQIDPMISVYNHQYNHLTDYEYVNANSTSYLMDLKISKEKFLSNLNQSTRHNIKKFIENYDYKMNFYSGLNSSRKIFDEYQHAHFESAGRMTRSQETFDLQYKMMEDNEAILSVLSLKGKNLGYLFTSVFQNTAFLFSIANLPEHENDYPIYKVIMLEIFIYLKNKRYHFANFGRPCTASSVQGFLDYSDEKGLRISKYKRAYGPYIIENFRGIKYLNTKSMIDDLDNFKNNMKKIVLK
jgi:hypothetical protein